MNKIKCVRKQKRAHHRLMRDMNIESSDEPTEVSEHVFSQTLYMKQFQFINKFTVYHDMQCWFSNWFTNSRIGKDF